MRKVLRFGNGFLLTASLCVIVWSLSGPVAVAANKKCGGACTVGSDCTGQSGDCENKPVGQRNCYCFGQGTLKNCKCGAG